MKQMMTRKQMIEMHKEQAKRFAVSPEGVQPVVFLYVEEGNDLAVPGQFENDKQKHWFFEQVRALAKDKGAYGGMWICEAWCLKCDEDNYVDPDSDDYVRPSEHPERIEILSILAADHAGTTCLTVEIKRDGDKITLGEEQWLDDGQTQDAMFQDVFRKVSH